MAGAAPATDADAVGQASSDPIPAAWSSPGQAGWSPGIRLGSGDPWTLAGLVLGAWRLDAGVAPAALPAPGIAEAQPPLAWFDSTDIVIGGEGAWLGFGAALASARGTFEYPPDGRARGVVTSSTSDVGIQRHALAFRRGTERNWIQFGATGDQRKPVGPLGRAASHVWTTAAGAARGEHAVHAGYAQRGHGAEQQLGFGEGATGESGELGWRWSRDADFVAATIARGHDGRQSYDAGTGVVEYSRRDAQSNGARLELGTRRGGNDLRLAVHGTRERVARQGAGAFSARAEAWWASAGLTRPLAGGTLDLQLGGGWHSALEPGGDDVQLAPGASWTLADESYRARVFAERIVTPVWADLAPGVDPFLQSNWLAGLDVGARRGAGADARLGLVAGRTRNRALLYRYPIRDVSLRIGVDRDDATSEFVLLTASGAARWRVLGFTAEGYLFERDPSARQPAVDPPVGASGGIECTFRFFQNDLAVRMRAQIDAVGEREALEPAGVLPGYGTASALLELGLGDAVFAFRGLNLEGIRQPDVWQDPETGGRPLGPGREFRFDITWTFFN